VSPALRGLAPAAVAGALLSAARGAAQEVSGPEVLHMPPLERHAEQGILRPVPISVELPRDVAVRARRVLVHYRLWGDPDWTTIELRRSGARYEGAVPCLEISTVTGDLRYHIRVHDVDGRVIASGASRAKPYLVTIKHDTTLAPGARRAARCPDPADCPLGLLGCPSEPVVEIPCHSDSDCTGGMTCGWRGYCERTERRTSWVSLSIEQDAGVISTTGACSVHAQENEGYACYRADGQQYIGAPVLTNEPLGAGPGPTRVVLGYERLVYFDTSVGVRAGWAVAGDGPTSRGGTELVPFSMSVRATHWFNIRGSGSGQAGPSPRAPFGDDPFGRSGFRPFAFVTAGYSMFDIKTESHVREDPTAPVFQGGNDLEQTVTVWKRAGDGFVGVGGGLAFAFSARFAAFAEVDARQAFPIGAFVVAPSAGVALGF
jgi:hypothetical protein